MIEGEEEMNVGSFVKERRSIRKFRPEPVPEELVQEILREARWAPSWGNTQPWEFYVVTGESLEKFRNANRAKLESGAVPAPDVRMPGTWPERLRERYGEVGKSTLEALGIAREDAAARAAYVSFEFQAFDAPCLIVACVDRNSASIEYAMLDVGLITQNICLLAHSYGLGTCIIACAVWYPEVLRAVLPDGKDRLLVAGIALGYPDKKAPINNFDRRRAPLDEIVTWVK